MRPLVDPQRLSSYRALLENRDYRRWFWSSLGSSFGDWVGLFALQVLVVSLADPGSRLALFGLGGIMMARLLPSVLFGPVAGVLADRYDRKRLMLTADVSRAALFVAIAFSRDLVALLALTFLVECVSLLYLSAKNAALPALVDREELTEANQLTLLVTYGPLPFGAAAAAVLTWLSGLLDDLGWITMDATTVALLVNAATFLLAGALIVRLRSIPAPGGRATADAPEETPPMRQELRDGVAFIGEHPRIRALIIGVIGVFFGAGVIITLGPEFVRTELGRSEGDWYGLMTVVGSGLLAGLVAVPVIQGWVAKARLLPVALILTGVAATLSAIAPSFATVQPLAFALGALAGISLVTGFTLLHEQTDDETRGRTFAAFYTGTRISMFAALAVAPFVAGALGRWTVELVGASITVSGIRVTMVLGGLAALLSAAGTARGLWRGT